MYIGLGIAYKAVSARGGNLKKREKAMASKKKATKKLRKSKKIQPTKPLQWGVGRGAV
jgi:hypothetical protein